MSFYIKSRHESFSDAIKAAQAFASFDTYAMSVDGVWCVVRETGKKEPEDTGDRFLDAPIDYSDI